MHVSSVLCRQYYYINTKVYFRQTPARKTKHYTTPDTLGKKHARRFHSVTTVAETVEDEVSVAILSSGIRQLSGMLVDGNEMDFEKVLFARLHFSSRVDFLLVCCMIHPSHVRAKREICDDVQIYLSLLLDLCGLAWTNL